MSQIDLIDEKFKGVYARIDSNNTIYELKLKELDSKIDTNHEELKKYILQVLEQTTKTNGRVTKIEKTIKIISLIGEYPKLTTLLCVSLLSLLYYLQSDVFFNKLSLILKLI